MGREAEPCGEEGREAGRVLGVRERWGGRGKSLYQKHSSLSKARRGRGGGGGVMKEASWIDGDGEEEGWRAI